MTRTIDFRVENNRQAYLDWLYERAGRTCSTYTGLYLQRQQELIDADFAQFCTSPTP
jgi:hypothetical protein